MACPDNPKNMESIMFSEVLRRSDARLSALQCCKQDGSICDCVSTLHTDFTDRPDTYNCEKKMSTYVLRYGAAYASEIYHYLVASNFGGKIDVTRPLNVISLGCGFSPDYFAIKKYFEVNNIHQPIRYTGVDSSPCWEPLRPNVNECTYISGDITSSFTLNDPDVVVVGKVFSTLWRNNKDAASAFLVNLGQVANTFRPGTILMFADINHVNFGRDVFHQNVSTFLPNCTQYYFDGGYTGNNWTCIQQAELVFDIPDGLSPVPHVGVGKTVVFEYRK